MRWSFSIARVAGIDVRLHVTFVLLLAIVGYFGYRENGGTPGAVAGVALALALFTCVLLHEFGHALAARRFGIKTPDITLLPIGGVARMERMPDNPWQEIIVAIAGPAVNVAIAAVLIVGFGAHVPLSPWFGLGPPNVHPLDFIARLNVMLVAFNLLPAFPMDGGRVLRALLAMRMRYARATQIAAWVGQGFCFLFAAQAVLFPPHNVLHIALAFFLYIAGAQEADAAKLRDVASGLRVADAMVTEFSALPAHAVLDDAVSLLLRTSQHEFPVVDGEGRVEGILTRDELIAALKKHGPGAPVGDVMRRDLRPVHAFDPLDTAFRLMHESQCPALPVLDSNGRLAGLITTENVGELMVVHSLRLRVGAPAWRARPPAPPAT